MGRTVRIGFAIALCASLALAAQPASAGELAVSAASERAGAFAERTCSNDESCVAHGVAGCQRQRPRVVLCRIFVARDTDVQGRYRCTRKVRLSQIPGTEHARVSGLGHWRC